MRTTIFITVAAAVVLLGAGAPAEAAGSNAPVTASDEAATLIPVVEGCGYGGHRDRRGRCRADYDERGALYAYRHYGRQFFRRHGYDAPDY